MRRMVQSKRVVISTFGSLGDVFPYIAVAKELAARGVSVAIATNADHHEMLAVHGIEGIEIGRRIRPMFQEDPDLARKTMDQKTGLQFVLQNLVMRPLKANYEQLLAKTDGVDLIVTHTLAYHALLVARTRGIPFVSTILSPINFWSKYDPPAMDQILWLPKMHKIWGATISGIMMKQMSNHVYSWGEPYRELQRELGMEVDTRNVFFEGQFSPIKNLGLFSPVFGPPQPDWPPNAVATGFPFLDEHEEIPEEVRDKVREFLQAGDAPVVFTLGTSAVWDAGTFYHDSVEALKACGLRGVLLVGKELEQNVPPDLPDTVIAVPYLPHALIFRHARAIVHQGGVGTTAQALRSGNPQLVMPFSHDQFDNAQRVERLGCGVWMQKKHYNAGTACGALRKICSGQFRAKAAEVGKLISEENGAAKAADEIMGAMQLVKSGKS
jgi:UDP:flavonoid glycosyltransferase YjiC (YdhE family)